MRVRYTIANLSHCREDVSSFRSRHIASILISTRQDRFIREQPLRKINLPGLLKIDLTSSCLFVEDNNLMSTHLMMCLITPHLVFNDELLDVGATDV